MLLLFLVIAACDQSPAGMLEPCTSDAACPDDLQCLAWSGAYEASDAEPDTASSAFETICSTACVEAADCPTVWSLDCGHSTVCSAGVCGWRYCY